MNKKHPQILILDDKQVRHDNISLKYKDGEVIFNAYNVNDAIRFLEKFSPFDVVYLDHDLGLPTVDPNSIFPASDEKSGYEVAKYIVNMKLSERPKRVIIHSINPAGAQRMESLLRRTGLVVKYQPFFWAER